MLEHPLARVVQVRHVQDNADAAVSHDAAPRDAAALHVEAVDVIGQGLNHDLLGQQQIVVKPLPPYVNSFDVKSCGISGCSIMGDGSISIILDVASLYSAGQGMF